MLKQEKTQNPTIEELETLLKFLRRDIRYAELYLEELKFAETGSKTSSQPEKTTALKRQLLKRGLKQKILAERLGISTAAVSLQIKTGIHMAKVAAKYAEALNCDPCSLLDFD